MLSCCGTGLEEIRVAAKEWMHFPLLPCVEAAGKGHGGGLLCLELASCSLFFHVWRTTCFPLWDTVTYTIK